MTKQNLLVIFSGIIAFCVVLGLIITLNNIIFQAFQGPTNEKIAIMQKDIDHINTSLSYHITDLKAGQDKLETELKDLLTSNRK